MRLFGFILGRDQTQNRDPLLLIALGAMAKNESFRRGN
jgi:hypothetical protein